MSGMRMARLVARNRNGRHHMVKIHYRSSRMCTGLIIVTRNSGALLLRRTNLANPASPGAVTMKMGRMCGLGGRSLRGHLVLSNSRKVT